jgi:hypothetical protein
VPRHTADRPGLGTTRAFGPGAHPLAISMRPRVPVPGSPAENRDHAAAQNRRRQPIPTTPGRAGAAVHHRLAPARSPASGFGRGGGVRLRAVFGRSCGRGRGAGGRGLGGRGWSADSRSGKWERERTRGLMVGGPGRCGRPDKPAARSGAPRGASNPCGSGGWPTARLPTVHGPAAAPGRG